MENRRVTMNNKTNLLELEEHMYPLVDVKTPNVFRNLFPYSEVPKIAFNDRVVPHHMPEDIWITDTTFRDGQQSRAPYSTEQIVTIFDYLHKLGGPKGKVRQSEFFLYSKKDRDAVIKCMERGYKFPEVTSWIRANKKDFELVKDIGMKETGILVSCSDYHIFYKMKMTRREAMEHYLNIIRDCLEIGVSPRCHLEDITRADIYGYVIPFCLELMRLMEFYQIPIKVRCCDTMGYGVNYPGAVIPRSVPGIIYGIMTHAGVPSELIEWHGHNDFYKAVTNSTTAWLYGASGVNCSLFGIGERTGNTPLEAMVFEYAQLRGTLDGMDTREDDNTLKVRQTAGMVFQNPDNQIVTTVVEEDVGFGPENLGVPTEEILRRVHDALEAVDMLDYAKSAPHMLSGGQKQRIAIAGMLAIEPQVLVLDEATAMLDPLGRKDILRIVKDLNRKKGITVIMITQYMEEAVIADRVIVMNEGLVAFEGTPAEVFRRGTELRKINLDVPPMVELRDDLAASGIIKPCNAMTVEEMANELCPLLLKI